MTSKVGPSISLRVIIYNTHGCSILWKGFKTVTKIFRFIIRRLKFAMHRHLSGMSLWASLKSMRRLNVFCYIDRKIEAYLTSIAELSRVSPSQFQVLLTILQQQAGWSLQNWPKRFFPMSMTLLSLSSESFDVNWKHFTR